MLSMNTTTAFRRCSDSNGLFLQSFTSHFFFKHSKNLERVIEKKFKSKVAFNLLFLVSTLSSKSGQIQMTVDANNIQAKSIYHGAKKNKTLFLSLLRLGALKVLDSSASVKSVKLLSSLGGKPCKTTVL